MMWFPFAQGAADQEVDSQSTNVYEAAHCSVQVGQTKVCPLAMMHRILDIASLLYIFGRPCVYLDASHVESYPNHKSYPSTVDLHSF